MQSKTNVIQKALFIFAVIHTDVIEDLFPLMSVSYIMEFGKVPNNADLIKLTSMQIN